MSEGFDTAVTRGEQGRSLLTAEDASESLRRPTSPLDASNVPLPARTGEDTDKAPQKGNELTRQWWVGRGR
jgi:hypothetical protein